MKSIKIGYSFLDCNGKLFFLLFLVSVLLYNPLTSTAQKNYFSVEADMSAGWRILTNKNSEKYVKKRNLEENPVGIINLTFKYNTSFADYFTFSTGIGYLKYGYQYYDQLIDPCFSPTTCGYRFESHKYEFTYLAIPLELSIKIKNRFSITPGLGLNFPLQVRRKWILMKNSYRFINDKIQVNESVNELKKIMLSSRIDLKYLFNKNSFFFDEISIFGSMMISKFENNHIENSLYNISLIVNENKLLEERLINFGVSLKHFINNKR